MDDINQIKTIKPTIMPFKCPVCSGFGTLKYGKIVCHSCQGKGYILVDQKQKEATYGESTT